MGESASVVFAPAASVWHPSAAAVQVFAFVMDVLAGCLEGL